MLKLISPLSGIRIIAAFIVLWPLINIIQAAVDFITLYFFSPSSIDGAPVMFQHFFIFFDTITINYFTVELIFGLYFIIKVFRKNIEQTTWVTLRTLALLVFIQTTLVSAGVYTVEAASNYIEKRNQNIGKCLEKDSPLFPPLGNSENVEIKCKENTAPRAKKSDSAQTEEDFHPENKAIDEYSDFDSYETPSQTTDHIAWEILYFTRGSLLFALLFLLIRRQI